jgi:hypothetical protein
MSYKAAVVYTITDWTQKVYNFSFTYLKKKFIKVSLISASGTTSLTYGSDYTVDASGFITLLINVDTSFVKIKIYRQTETDPIVSWVDASTLRATDMNIIDVQMLNILDEYSDYIDDTIEQITNTALQAALAEMQTLLASAQTKVNLAQSWAMSGTSPDDATDTDSDTGKTMSAKSWSLKAKQEAQVIKNIGAQTGRILEAFSVTYDDNGEYKTIEENGVTYTITRTSGNRLDEITDGATTLKAQYDSNGIFTGMTEISGV